MLVVRPSARSKLVVNRVRWTGLRRIRARLARYSCPGGGENVGKAGSGAITGTSLVGAAVVAGPTGAVGWGTAVGAARYGVAGAGAAVPAAGKGVAPVWTPGTVSLVGIGAKVESTAGATGAGFSAGAKRGADGRSGAPVSSRAAATPAIAKSRSASNTTCGRLSESIGVVRSTLTAAGRPATEPWGRSRRGRCNDRSVAGCLGQVRSGQERPWLRYRPSADSGARWRARPDQPGSCRGRVPRMRALPMELRCRPVRGSEVRPAPAPVRTSFRKPPLSPREVTGSQEFSSSLSD